MKGTRHPLVIAIPEKEVEIGDNQGIRTAGKNSQTTEEEHAPQTASGEAGPRTEIDGTQDFLATGDSALAGATNTAIDTETAITTRGDPDPEDAQTKIACRSGTEEDIHKMMEDKDRGKDLEAPTPIMTGEGTAAGTRGTTGTHEVTRETGIDLRTTDTDNKYTRTTTRLAGSDSSPPDPGGACHQKLT